ncbi:MAG: hypothetical protein HLUCCX14_11015 [Marinobacter excellens HL-55]|uniref:Uncharacterized protein n=1 Tax=Marinobacter excellens HL-55 TaxID=1305731 RepID=A0A0P7ZG44_9GAMM|nr:MAG: hypothetical protein HLUCCX14_11015 [Marinobacter excellens HL-55]
MNDGSSARQCAEQIDERRMVYAIVDQHSYLPGANTGVILPFLANGAARVTLANES